MAAELVGGALLSSFLQVAFDRLASRDVLDYFRGRRLDEMLLKKLNITLLSIDSVIDDAELTQFTNPRVKDWLDEVKHAVYDAEDVLEEIDYELTKRKLEAESHTAFSSKVRNLFFNASVSSFDEEIESRMKQALDYLQFLESRKTALGLKEGSGGAVRSMRNVPTTSLVDEARICGREDDKELIVKWLLSNNDSDNNFSVISIVGMGGLGKTTLAQLVYNDQRVKDEFDLEAWVCVSDDFDVTRVTRTIFEAFTVSNDDTKDLNMLQIKLKEKLARKRFLLVLDDVWSENYRKWEALQTPFTHGALGSKILVTTRSDKVASTMRSDKSHSLKVLTMEDSWLLFRRYAFRDRVTPHSNSNFEEIGRKIIGKCKGLPLALTTIASLLYTKSSYEEWNDVLKSEIWEEEESNILPALRLSYYYLPSLLKRCFAYCSLFPKDYEFDKDCLIQLWMAENFLQCAHQDKDIRKVGDQFFHDLYSRSFFQQSSKRVNHFVMHDLINDLAKYVSGKLCYRLENGEAHNVSEMTRQFSYLLSDYYETSKRFKAIYKTRRLRTFMPLPTYLHMYCITGGNVIQDLLSKCRCLRVLSLFGYESIKDLPETIVNLKHLRYLDLSWTSVKRLPESICLLHYLQTLKLRYCSSLEMLPVDLHKLINLRHLDFYGTKVCEMPKNLGKLKNLQVLSSFYVGKCSETNIKQLEELNNLGGELSILELQNVHPKDALAINLKDKIHLRKLTLGWCTENNESEIERNVLEKLYPHPNLKDLSVSNYGGTRFPYWFVDNTLSNLVSLELSNCKYCFSLPPLGLLPSLNSLSIAGFDSIVSIGPEFYGNSTCTTPFGSLEILWFQNMVRWEEWKCENVLGVFPRLQELYIRKCHKLKEHLPPQLPSLMKLSILECEQLVASIPSGPAIHDLYIGNSEKVKLECLPSSLKRLNIDGNVTECFLIEKFEKAIANISCLEELDISGWANLELPLHNCHYNFVRTMSIFKSCDSLRRFPLDLFPKLQSLSLQGCSNLEMISIPEGHNHGLTSLTSLTIWDCPKFVSLFPEGGYSVPKLEECWVANMESLIALPKHMRVLFPSLNFLVIWSCPQVESFPEGGLPLNLEKLTVSQCPKLTASRMEWDLHSLTSLRFFQISDADAECLPDVGLLPPTLTALRFTGCANLRALDYKGLCHLTSLKELRLEFCPILQCLPEEGLPSSLSTLYIVGCPLLEKRCQDQKGQYWAKIAHIPCLIINDEILN